MDRISISRLFDPRNLDHFQTDDLEAILMLNGFYPSREDIRQAKEKYDTERTSLPFTCEGATVSKVQVEDELCKQRDKPAIQTKVLFDEIKSMLKVQNGCFNRNDLVTLFAEQNRPLEEEDLDTLLQGICDNGVVKFRGFLNRLTRPTNSREERPP